MEGNVLRFPGASKRQGSTVFCWYRDSGVGVGSGDMIEVDFSIHEIDESGLYLVRLDGLSELRRVQVLLDGRVRVDAGDARCAEIVECRRVRVAGRVVRHWRLHEPLVSG